MSLQSRITQLAQAIGTDIKALLTAVAGKQATLVSGTNIKTAGGQNLLGSGNAPIVAPETHAATAKTTPVDADELGLSDSAASWGLKRLTFANLKTWIGGLFVSKSGDTINGDLDFSGAGRRITGDFSNSSLANRLLFQTSTVNGNTDVGAIPNGTSVTTGFRAWSTTDPNNASFMRLYISATAELVSGVTGSGTSLPMTFAVNGAERMRINTNGKVGIGTSAPDSYVANTLQINGASASLRITDASSGATKDDGVELYLSGGIAELMQRENALLGFGTNGLRRMIIDAAGNVLVTGGGALGYGAGAGGAVAQATSKSTAVALNKPCGRVTMFNDPTNFPAQSAIPAGGEITFQVNNNLVTLTDIVIALPVAASSYLVQVLYVSTGLFVVRIFNKTGASLSEQISINFVVIKSTLS